MSTSHPVDRPGDSSRPGSLPVLARGTDEFSPLGCCGWLRRATGRRLAIGAAAMTAAVLLVAGIAFVFGRWSVLESRLSANAAADLPLIDATAAVSGENFSMATGMVSADAEGLFLLDHNSGLLQCTVVYPRIGQFAASFTANVGDALATRGKGGKYLMVTGLTDFPQSSATPIGQSVVYVLDTATGNYAAYVVPFNRVMLNSNQPQVGPMRLLAVGTASPIVDRDRR